MLCIPVTWGIWVLNLPHKPCQNSGGDAVCYFCARSKNGGLNLSASQRVAIISINPQEAVSSLLAGVPWAPRGADSQS